MKRPSWILLLALPSCASEPLPNFARIDEGLYRGGQPDEEGFARLKAMGVKTLVNLRRFHSERDAAQAAGFSVVEIPMNAALTSTPPSDEQIARFFQVVLDPARRPVYLHCAHGQDRTGTLAAVYRIEIQGWTPERAIEEMQALGYHDVYRDLIEFVRAYRPRGYRKE